MERRKGFGCVCVTLTPLDILMKQHIFVVNMINYCKIGIGIFSLERPQYPKNSLCIV